MIGARSTDQGI